MHAPTPAKRLPNGSIFDAKVSPARPRRLPSRTGGKRFAGPLGDWSADGILVFLLIVWLGVAAEVRATGLLSPGMDGQRVVSESARTLTIQVARLVPLGISGDVDYWTTNGLAVAGEDYVPVAGTLRFGPSGATLPVVIEILDDGRADGDKTFTLVTQESGVAASFYEPVVYPVRVEDDEEPAILDETFRPDLPLGIFYYAPQGAVAVWSTPDGNVAAVVEEEDVLTPFGPQPRSRVLVLGRAGQVLRSIPLSMGATRVLEDSAGRHLVVGTSVARVLADGSLDPTFDPESLRPLNDANGSLLALQNDGKFLVGGRRGVFERYHPDGTRDETFHSPTLRTGLTTNGPVVEGWISAARALADGSILIGGDFTRVDGEVRLGIARLKPTGELDPEFELEHGLWTQTDPLDPATAVPGMVGGFDVDRVGRILVTGSFTLAGATRRPYLVRLRSSGDLDPTFPVLQLARSTEGNPPSLLAAMELPDGDVVVAGRSFDRVEGSRRVGLARITTRLTDSRLRFDQPQINVPEYAGSVDVTVRRLGDTTEAARVRVSVTSATAEAGMDFESQAVLLEFPPRERVRTLTIPVLNDDLPEPDETFNISLEEPQGAVVLDGGITRIVIRDDDRAGARDWTFNPPAVEYIGAVIPRSDEMIYLGAAAVALGQHLARLLPDGSVDPSWYPRSAGAVIHAAFSDGSVLVNARDAVEASAFRVRPDGTWDPRWKLDPAVEAAGRVGLARVDPQDRVVLLTTSYRVEGGKFTTIQSLLRVLSDGRLDDTFKRYELAAGDLEGLALDESGGILVAQRSVVRQWPDGSEYPEFLFTRVTSGGLLDVNFQPPLRMKRFDYGASFAPEPDGHCWVAAATEFFAGAKTTAGVVRLRADGSVEESSMQGDGFRRADGKPARLSAIVRLENGQLLVAGFFTEVQGVRRRHVVRLEANGALDPRFDLGDDLALGLNSDGVPDIRRAAVFGIAVTASGQLLIRGDFDSFNGEPSPGLAKVVLGTSPWLRLVNARAGAGARVELSGAPGQRYVLQESADLERWEAVATNATTNGRTSFDRPVNAEGRYFRALRP